MRHEESHSHQIGNERHGGVARMRNTEYPCRYPALDDCWQITKRNVTVIMDAILGTFIWVYEYNTSTQYLAATLDFSTFYPLNCIQLGHMLGGGMAVLNCIY